VEIHCKCVEKYGIVENATSIIAKEFFATIRKHLKPLVILKPLVKSLLVLKSFHEIIYILDTINDSHIPIITPKIKIIFLLERFLFHIDLKSCKCKM
jgi:hypothetical protein